MNRTLRHALLLGLAATVSQLPALAQKKDKADSTFATVNGKAIPKVRADALIAGQAAQGQPDSPELRKAVTEELVRREVLTQESMKKGFDKKPEVQGQIDLARQGVLIGAYLNDYVKTHPVTDEQIKKEYEDIKAKLGSKEYKARHVLVENRRRRQGHDREAEEGRKDRRPGQGFQRPGLQGSSAVAILAGPTPPRSFPRSRPP
jgi:peptidyl-prolyl cis-trans isomerase C